MKTLMCLGATGMLGHKVLQVLNSNPQFLVEGTCRYGNSIDSISQKHRHLIRLFPEVRPQDIPEGWGDYTFLSKFKDYIDEVQPEAVINCVGKIKPHSMKDPALTVYINGVLPHQLATICKDKSVKLLHISSDCAMSGRVGNYDENSPHDPLDLYGKTKSIGEPSNCMVIRTSIIGEEINNNSSLIAWARSQKGKRVNGFRNHLWNGVTTNTLAHNIATILTDNLYSEGVFHVYAKDDVTKYKLLCLLNEHLKLDLTIDEVDSLELINRTLRTVKELNGILNNPTVEQMIIDMVRENGEIYG